MDSFHGSLEEVNSRFRDAQSRLVLQASDLSLATIARMVDEGAIDLAPSFQRRERWDAEKQSALIESFLLNIPVPPIYLAEEEFGRYTVIDGKQRVSAMHAFLNKNLRLRKLESFSALSGATFAELPAELRNALTVRPYVRAVTLLRQTDPLLKYEVFTRLNRGGETLNPQELRNVAFRGRLNDTLIAVARDEFLRAQLKIVDERRSPAFQQMADVELVLRFVTLRSTWSHFSGDLRSSMDDFMRSGAAATDEECQVHARHVRHALHACRDIWGDKAFYRPQEHGWRGQLLVGMYDAQMLATAVVSGSTIKAAVSKRSAVLESTRRLFRGRMFDQAVRTGTNTPSRIAHRVNAIVDMLKAQ